MRALRPVSLLGEDGAAPRAVDRSSLSLGVRHRVLTVVSHRPFDCIDVTTAVADVIRDGGLRNGFVVAQTQHTTTGVMVNEYEPLLLEDVEALFERVAPAAARTAHDDFRRRRVNLMPGERRNGHAHCRALLLRTSEWLAVVDGALVLGRWQRVFFVECDGDQTRQLLVTLVGELDADQGPRTQGP